MKFHGINAGLSAISWACAALIFSQPALADLDQARANAIWDRVLQQQSTLYGRQTMPKSWDDARGITGQVASGIMRAVTFSYFESRRLRKEYDSEVAIAGNQIPAIKRDMKETAARGPDNLQARLEEFDKRLGESASHLKKAGELWQQYTGVDTSSAETVETGAKAVAIGATAAEVVLTGGLVLEVAGGVTVVGTGAAAVAPLTVGMAGAVGVHAPILAALLSKPSSEATGSAGQAGGANPGGTTEIAIDTTPVVEPPAPVVPPTAPGIITNDHGTWDVKDKDKEPVKKPVPVPAKPVPPKAKPVVPVPPKPKPVVPVPPTPVPTPTPSAVPVLADPNLGHGNIFGTTGPHMPALVGGIGAGDKSDEIKCDADSQKAYRDLSRKDKNDRSNWPDIILGQQQLYFCKINVTDFSNDPRAVFLSRFGLRAAAIGQVNLFLACLPDNMKTIKTQLKGIQDDIKTLETADASPELKKVEADYGTITHDIGCTDLATLIFSDGDTRLQQLNTDLCAWKKVSEDPARGGRLNMWLGISYALVQCP